MNYRNTKLLAQTDVGPSGTKSIDINLDQPMSRITIEWQVLKGLAYMTDAPHIDISKIELVDGSDVLFSMNGGQAQALNIYDRKCGTMNYGAYINANVQLSYYGIDFGRFLFDPLLALDPTKFRNLQLKVTYSEILSDTSGSAGSLEVRADVFDEKIISPSGFLMSKAIHEYTTGAHQSYEYIDLPTDHPYRKLLVQGYAKAYEPHFVVEEARLNEDAEKRIPFDWDLERYYIERKGIDTPVFEVCVVQPQGAGVAYYMTATDYWASLITQGQTAGDQAGLGAEGKGGHFIVTSGGSSQAQCIHTGWLPNHCFQFPFGDQMDPEDWYDVTRISHLEMRLRAGSLGAGTGKGAIVLQQLRKY
jgi:hypothetical protein